MFHSHSLENEKFSMFALLLSKLISGDKNYQSAVDPIIREAACLSKGETNLYTINERDNLPIIIYLSDFGKEYLPTLDGKNVLETEDYRRIFDIVQTYSHKFHP